MNKKRRISILLILFLAFFNVKVYAKNGIADSLDKEWYCNIVKGNAINNYFNLPSIKEGLKIDRKDYETSADYDDAIDYYNLENYRITLNFKSANKVDIGWTSLLYNDNYEDSQHVKRTFTYQLNNNQGVITLKDNSYPFIVNDQALSVPSQNFVCYANLIEAQKNYKLYDLNEKYDKSMADEDGFVITNGILKKYLGSKRKLILPKTILEVADFDSDNVYYFSSLVIPGNVKKIDDSAFQYLNTDELVLQEGIEEIGNEAFLDSDFVDIYLPSSITKIGTNAFGSKLIERPTFHVVRGSFADNFIKNNYGQSDIDIEYDFEASDTVVKSCENYVNYNYNEVKKFLVNGFAIRDGILYACDKKTSVVEVPSGINTIASEAFSDYYNSKVKTIIIPESVKTIENGSFSFTSAKTIIFKEGLEKIESHALADVYAKDIYLPATIKKIGKNIFESEKGLKNTVFHVQKDSEIAKYLEKNPPEGKFQIVYDYEKYQTAINRSQPFNKINFIIFIAICVFLIIIILLITNLRKSKQQAKIKAINDKKHAETFEALSESALASENLENKEKIEDDQLNNTIVDVPEEIDDISMDKPSQLNNLEENTESNKASFEDKEIIAPIDPVEETDDNKDNEKSNSFDFANDNNNEQSITFDFAKDNENTTDFEVKSLISNEDNSVVSDDNESFKKVAEDFDKSIANTLIDDNSNNQLNQNNLESEDFANNHYESTYQNEVSSDENYEKSNDLTNNNLDTNDYDEKKDLSQEFNDLNKKDNDHNFDDELI